MNNPTGDALKASAAQVRVKPLEWEDGGNVQNGYTHRMIMEEAKTPFRTYYVEFSGNGEWWWSQNMRHPYGGPFKSKDDVKASAQADYDARILAALSPVEQAPQPVAAGTQALGDFDPTASRQFDILRDVSEQEIAQWAELRADDAGFLARKLISERQRLSDLLKSLGDCRSSICGYSLNGSPKQAEEAVASLFKEIERIDAVARSALAEGSR